MSPQQKAKEIYDKFYGIPLYIKTIKQCCYVVVDEILREKQDCSIHNCKGDTSSYWEEVKQEIEKL